MNDVVTKNKNIQVRTSTKRIEITTGRQGLRGPKGDGAILLPPTSINQAIDLTPEDSGKSFIADSPTSKFPLNLPYAASADELIYYCFIDNIYGASFNPKGNDTIYLGTRETDASQENIFSNEPGSMIVIYNIKSRNKWFTSPVGSWEIKPNDPVIYVTNNGNSVTYNGNLVIV